jgi:acyl-coenzyme A synthetase/AMP-(fatty) acid ligase
MREEQGGVMNQWHLPPCGPSAGWQGGRPRDGSYITAQVMAYIYSALLNGADVDLLDTKKDGLFQVADWLSQHKSTIFCSIPTVFPAFRGMLQGGERFPSLRLIRVGGEPVYQKDIDLYKRLFPPSCLFVNRLGLTETGSVRWHFIYPTSAHEVLCD